MKILKVIKDTSPYQFEIENQNGRKEIANVGASSEQEARDIILNRPKPDKVAIAKRNKISEVKRLANVEIEKQYPKYKQINYSLAIEVNDYNNTTKINEMKAYLKSIIEQSETMESEINALKTEQEVKDYKINFGSL